ncbi:MAG: hypothetical protein IT176_11685 [Acidobacteria bacterium]|nr:hypothetical protein [Acidobacteriota bacterium]
MSGLIAIVGGDGAPCERRRLIEGMLAAQAYRGPDATGVWIGRSAGLGHGQLAATPEDLLEPQPHVREGAGLAAVLDGRLDNRDDLTRSLRSRGCECPGQGDAAILLSAYETWGASAAGRLLGDFAFAIWDERRQMLVCGRDILGCRPLYVHRRAGFLAIASELAPLLACPGVSREPNEGFVGELLSGLVVHRTDTVWRDIVRLEPGHLLIFDHGELSSRPFWRLDPSVEIRYRRDEEYGEHLRELLTQSVQCRTRSAGRFGVMLSGGIDSSAVAWAAHGLRGPAGDPLPTYSIVGPGQEWDESEYMAAVAASQPITGRQVEAFVPPAGHFAAAAVRVQDIPPYPNGEMGNTLFRTAAGDGVRVLLTGFWSDEWFTGSDHRYADLLADLHLIRLWRHLRALPEEPDGFRPPSVFRATVWPLIPSPVREAVKGLLGRDAVAPWIAAPFARRTRLAARLRPWAPDLAFSTRALADAYTMAFAGLTIQTMEAHDRSVAQFGVDTRHPFGDRRIIEFAFALPEDQRWREGITKFVLRTATRDVLPPMVGGRTTHATAGGAVAGAIEGLWSAGLWHNAETVRRGWVDGDAMRGAIGRMTSLRTAGDEGYENLANQLWLACAVELWAAHVLGGRHVSREPVGC